MQRRNFIASFLALLAGNGFSAPQAPAAVTQPLIPRKIPPPRSETNPYLADWLRIPQQPLLEISEVPTSDHETATLLFQHIQKGTPIPITYHGGTEPNKQRTITPILLFHKISEPKLISASQVFSVSASTPFTYLLAYCHLRHNTRTFRLDRIEI